MLSEPTTKNNSTTASEDDLRAFVNWLAGNNMPSVDTYGWLLRCEQWVKTQLSEKGISHAGQRSNQGDVKV